MRRYKHKPYDIKLVMASSDYDCYFRKHEIKAGDFYIHLSVPTSKKAIGKYGTEYMKTLDVKISREHFGSYSTIESLLDSTRLFLSDDELIAVLEQEVAKFEELSKRVDMLEKQLMRIKAGE